MIAQQPTYIVGIVYKLIVFSTFWDTGERKGKLCVLLFKTTSRLTIYTWGYIAPKVLGRKSLNL